jgi:hypothetical protein
MKQESKYQGQERRKNMRWYYKAPAEFMFFSDLVLPSIAVKISGTVHNISATGFAATVSFDEETQKGIEESILKVGVVYNLPGCVNIKALGRIVWMKPLSNDSGEYLFGMEFMDILDTSRLAIQSCIIDYYLQTVTPPAE